MSNVGLFLTQAIHGHWRTSQGRIQEKLRRLRKLETTKIRIYIQFQISKIRGYVFEPLNNFDLTR